MQHGSPTNELIIFFTGNRCIRVNIERDDGCGMVCSRVQIIADLRIIDQ